MKRSRIRNEEELNQILTNAELDDTAKAEAIKGLVGKSFVPTKKYTDEKKSQTEAYNSLKAEFETYKQSKMTDEEKREELARLQAEENKCMKLQLNEMTAKNIFSEAGLKKEDYENLISSVVQEDTEKTKILAETICKTIAKQKKDIEKALTDKILKETKTPPAGNDNGTESESNTEKYKKLYEEAQKRNDYSKMAYYTRLIQETQKNNEE